MGENVGTRIALYFRVDDELRYLDARKVQSPAGTLADLELCSRDNQNLGTVEGVIIEPARRRVRYFVVKRGGWLAKDRFLLPVESLACLESERVLRIDDSSAEVSRRAVDLGQIPRFSPEDVVTAIFAETAA
jgi:PRC-barrel domain